MKKIKVGIVGLGLAGYELHARAYHEIEPVEIYALCSRSTQKLQKIAKEFNVSKTYTEYNQMLQDEQLEAVSICVTDPLHFEYSRLAVEYGKHVLCEKPLVTNLKDARALISLVKKSKIKTNVTD